ncbi:hypothetical protein N7492_009433 [Penicillium capsulatum]|uniref:Homeobox and C2H2 transcription factor n=1 Tax=Penicillium capsulatum TaxID=69766 RepID=A0A9W9HUW6_9EURO|nr:hypothetical protein N7492_009433 [Penicillium capsulatum]KAJ6106823.1 hypothetical protein N7512_010340 [Penicillium capsulatum]
MERQPPFDPSSYQLPQSLPDSGLPGIPENNNTSDDWLSDEIASDWNSLNDFYFCTSAPASSEWSTWMNQAIPTLDEPAEPSDQGAETIDPSLSSTHLPSESSSQQIPLQSLGNVSQWLEGAFRPPIPCSYCRKHRLQCLTIRTTPANPNPVTSCSSCVALFRECSLSKGEKRLPSGFETFTPVLGHLHGLPEHADPAETMSPPTGAGMENLENTDDRKEPKQFVRRGARTLREWFHKHQEYPYPDENQRRELMRETGFSQKRISTWFANARRRQKQKQQSSNVASRAIPRAGSPLITSTLDTMTPMERWKASPPEDDPIPESAIQNAIASGATGFDAEVDPFQLDEVTDEFFNFEDSSSHLASSVSSFGSRASETSGSVSSVWSHQSGDGVPFPLLSAPSPSRRQRRPRGTGELQYQCTFCTQSFRKRHDWSRHEKSVHLTLDTWICTPDLGELQESWYAQAHQCRFCDTLFPSPSHWDEHDFSACAEKPMAERSFRRKDYLWQHLRKFHGCTQLPVPNLDAWRGTGGNVLSRCGFCNCTLPTWVARAEHLADHFKAGLRMEQWVGDWGLDASTLSVLRNATLPSQRIQTTS